MKSPRTFGEDKMNAWPYAIEKWSPHQIAEAIKDDLWQKFRVSLKGLSTVEKLNRLLLYRHTAKRQIGGQQIWQERCRIDNYLNALKRGGLLTIEGRIKR